MNLLLKNMNYFTVLSKHWLAMLFFTVIFLLGLLANWVDASLQYKLQLIKEGQVWRLVTGNFVHLGMYHTSLNLAAFLMWYSMFALPYRKGLWATLIFTCALCVGIGLFIFSPYTDYYAGFSGVIHGLFLYSCTLECRRDKFSFALLVLLLAKIVYEQLPSYDVNYLQAYMHAPVVVDAHLYGAIGGLLFALVQRVWRRSAR